MSKRNEQSGKAVYWVLVVALIAAGAAWLLGGQGGSRDDRGQDEAAAPGPTRTAPAQPTTPAPVVPAVAAPAVRIADKGRLAVTRDALFEGDVLALGLELPDEARGDQNALPVKVVDVSGRVLELDGAAVTAAGGGLRLEIDPDWLTPGRYLIQVKTVGSSPLPLRRYVLDVTDEAAADDGSAGP
jgi:hypothetical protein